MTKSAFGRRLRDYVLLNKDRTLLDIKSYFLSVEEKLCHLLESLKNDLQNYKIYISINIGLTNTIGMSRLGQLKYPMSVILKETCIKEFLTLFLEKIEVEYDDLQTKGSGFMLSEIFEMCIAINRYIVPHASSYIPLPKNLKNKQAIINPQNKKDHKCFYYAFLAKFKTYKPHIIHKNIYEELGHLYRWNSINFPTTISDILKFEKNNYSVSINLYEITNTGKCYPIRTAWEIKDDHRDIGIIQSRAKTHYVYIKNLDKLFSTSLSKRTTRKFLCRRCFNYFGKERLYNVHKKLCHEGYPTLKHFPKLSEKIKFRKISTCMLSYFNMAFDFESSLLRYEFPDNDPDYSWRADLSEHKPCAAGIYVWSSLPAEFTTGAPLGYHFVHGENVGKKFIDLLDGIILKLSKIMERNLPVKITAQQKRDHLAATNCFYCNASFSQPNVKRILHHCHLSGVYLATTCTPCNNKLRKGNINCYVHNISYDINFFIKLIHSVPGRVKVLSRNLCKFICVTKYWHKQKVMFKDSLRLLPGSLESWSKTLKRENLNYLAQEFGEDSVQLMSKKLIYCYDYISEYAQLQTIKTPPPQGFFFNSLTKSHVTDEEYMLDFC